MRFPTLSDFLKAGRSLLRDWRISTMAILILAIALGAASTIFSLVQAVLLEPLPFENPDRLVAVWSSSPAEGWDKLRPSSFDVDQWRQRGKVFDKMAMATYATFALSSLERPPQVFGASVTEDFFPILGVGAKIGRGFAAEDFTGSAAPVIVLSHALWMTHFGGRTEVVGTTVQLDQDPYTIVGVMPRQILPKIAEPSGVWTFDTDEPFFWIPERPQTPDHSGERGVLARLAPGVSLDAARTEIQRISQQMARDYPESHEGTEAVVVPLSEEAVGDVRGPLWLLLGAVALLVVIAAANVISLLLVRVASRGKELAIRAALGAGKGDVLRLFFVESSVLLLFGNVLGLFLSSLALRVVPDLTTENIPRLAQATIDGRVVGLALVLSAAIVLVFSLVSIGQIRWRSLEGDLREGGRSSSIGRRGAVYHRALVAIEMMLVVMLVIGSALLVRSFRQLQAVDLGSERGEMLIVELLHSNLRYTDMYQLSNFYDELLNEVRTVPGVISAAAAYDHPQEANWMQGFRLEGIEAPPGQDMAGLFGTVSAGYFEAMGIDVLEGRSFNSGDTTDAAPVAVINKALARKYFQDRNPIGRRLSTPPARWLWGAERPNEYTIVGVVEDVRSTGITSAPKPAFYLPLSQVPHLKMNVLIRTRGEAGAILPVFRDRLFAIDPGQPIASARELDEILEVQTSKQRFSTLVLSFFAAISLLLAVVNLWGVVNHSVLERRHEIGIRMALGATGGRILRLILLSSLQPIVVGLIAGVVGALALRSLLSGLLFGVSASDPMSYILVTLGLLLVAALATLPPTLRAGRTDPMRVLRAQ